MSSMRTARFLAHRYSMIPLNYWLPAAERPKRQGALHTMLRRRVNISERFQRVCRLVWVVVCAVLCWNSAQPGHGQFSWTHSYRSKEQRADYSTPQSTVAVFRRAVQDTRWLDEYECYSTRLQSRFTYFVCQSTRELDDSPELTPRLQRILIERRFPPRWLSEFPSLRSETIGNASEMDAQSALDQEAKFQTLQSALERWERDVFPGDTDWKGLIRDLQPLFERNFEHHRHQLHPSQFGIVSHLGMHWYDDLREGGFCDPDHYYGTIVARERGGTIVARERGGAMVRASSEARPGVSTRLKMPSFLSSNTWSFGLRNWGSAARPSGRIALIRQSDGWKIDEVPYR